MEATKKSVRCSKKAAIFENSVFSVYARVL